MTMKPHQFTGNGPFYPPNGSPAVTGEQCQPIKWPALWLDKPRGIAATKANRPNNNLFPRMKNLPPNCFSQLYQGFDNDETAFQKRISSSIPSCVLSLLRSSRFLPHDSGCNRLLPQNTASGKAGIHQRRGSHPRNYPWRCRNRHPR